MLGEKGNASEDALLQIAIGEKIRQSVSAWRRRLWSRCSWKVAESRRRRFI